MNTEKALSEWKVLDSKVVYQERLTIKKDRLQKPQGGEMDYSYLATKGAAAVLAFVDDEHVILTHQYRHPIRKVMLDLPAGGIQEGETPEDAARRELAEEIGYEAQSLEALGSFHPSPGLMSQTVYVFLAKVVKAGKRHLDEGEVIEPIRMPWPELLQHVLAGEGVDGTLAFAVLHYAMKKQAEKKPNE